MKHFARIILALIMVVLTAHYRKNAVYWFRKYFNGDV